MNKRKLLLVLSVFVVLVLALSMLLLACAKPAPSATTPAQSPAKVYEWKLTAWFTRGDIFVAFNQKFVGYVKDMSDGRIVVEDIYEGEGFVAADIHKAVSTGLFELGGPNPAMAGDLIPEASIELGLPGTPLTSLQEATLWYQGGFLDVFRKVYAKHNMQYLAPTQISPGGVLITTSPVKTLADVKTMKIRAPGAYGEFWSKLGAATVTMPFSEVYTSLATNVINGNSLSTLLDIKSAKFYEVAQYLYPIPVTGVQANGIVANMDAYNGLPKDLQAILVRAADVNCLDWLTTCLNWEQTALSEMMQTGFQYGPQPSAEDKAKFMEAAQAVWDSYATKSPE